MGPAGVRPESPLLSPSAVDAALPASWDTAAVAVEQLNQAAAAAAIGWRSQAVAAEAAAAGTEQLPPPAVVTALMWRRWSQAQRTSCLPNVSKVDYLAFSFFFSK